MKYATEAGENIGHAIRKAQRLARVNEQEVHFDFNGIDLCVRPSSCDADIGIIYSLECELRRWRENGRGST